MTTKQDDIKKYKRFLAKVPKDFIKRAIELKKEGFNLKQIHELLVSEEGFTQNNGKKITYPLLSHVLIGSGMRTHNYGAKGENRKKKDRASVRVLKKYNEELEAEASHYKKLYLEADERCKMLEQKLFEATQGTSKKERILQQTVKNLIELSDYAN